MSILDRRDRHLLSLAEGIGEIVDAAAIDPGQWKAVAIALHEAAPDCHVMFQAHDRAFAKPLPLVAVGWGDRTIDSYLGHYSAINPWVESWFSAPYLKAVCSRDALPDKALHKTEFYNDWLKRVGQAEVGTGYKIVHDNSRVANIAMHYDGRRADQYHAGLTRLFDRIGPRLSRAVEANRITMTLGAPPNTVLLDSLRDPAMLIRRDRKLLSANAAAHELLRAGSPARIAAADAVHFVDAETDLRFSTSVQAACTSDRNALSPDDFRAKDDTGVLTISVLAIAPNLHSLVLSGLSSLFMSESLALVIMRRQSKRLASDLLMSRYRCPPSETRVAMELLNGGTMSEISTRLGIGYETSRTHLKALYAKTGLRNQRDLLALILKIDGQ